MHTVTDIMRVKDMIDILQELDADLPAAAAYEALKAAEQDFDTEHGRLARKGRLQQGPRSFKRHRSGLYMAYGGGYKPTLYVRLVDAQNDVRSGHPVHGRIGARAARTQIAADDVLAPEPSLD